MKNKFIIFTLCFTIIFTNINLSSYKSYANNIEPYFVDGGVISAPMLATVSALAVGSGILISNSDDLYDLGRIFYNYIDSRADLTVDFVNSVFTAGHILIDNFVSVNSDFLDIVKDFFDTTFGEQELNITMSNYGVPFTNSSDRSYAYKVGHKLKLFKDGVYQVGSFTLEYYGASGWDNGFYVLLNGEKIGQISAPEGSTVSFVVMTRWGTSSGKNIFVGFYPNGSSYSYTMVDPLPFPINSLEFPYSGGYNWDNVNDRIDDDKSVSLPIPGNVGQLVGQTTPDFWNNTNDLVGGGSITFPGVDSPSIGVTDDVFVGSPSTDIPGVDSPTIPNEGLWENIKDFIISLVVPSDSFWTDTFNSFRDNLNKNFPMLDMSGFDSLLVNGKPFPNIYAYGSKVVDGDIINSIVDWLRPIVAGFIMICLMFFNYRKVYKTIRNSEPFGNIAPGTSDFSTGLSSADIKQIVADAKRETERRTYRR